MFSDSSFAQTGAHSGGQSCRQGGIVASGTVDSSGTSGAGRARARGRRRVVPKVSFMVVSVVLL